MESRSSGRADGRGWGGRGDSNARRGEPSRRPGEPAAGGPPPPDDRLRGAGEAPWVRLEDPERPAGERGGSARGAPPVPDLSSLLVVLEGMRGMVPREISAQINALVRELLLTLRAFIDWYLERLDGGPREPEVEEIPID
jgi:hypothetical protein